MKKALPYILGALLAIVVCYQFFGNKRKREVSTVVTLNRMDKNPYGSYVFFESLKSFFKKSSFKINYDNPADTKVFGDNKPDQLYVIMQPAFSPESYEFDDLVTFIDRGNNVFISTFYINQEVEKFIKTQSGNTLLSQFTNKKADTMKASLSNAFFTGTTQFSYPGLLMESVFKKTDTSISSVMGTSNNDKPNLIHLKKGNGNLYIQLSPLALSNYFLLYKDNIQYFEKIFSQFPATTSLVIWDEYFSNPNRQSQKDSGWFSSIMKNVYFRAGILTALLLLLIYTLTEMRRKQRIIPVMERPVNDSLEFVKTMGLLYYEKSDHKNLAIKMSSYFLENVRTRYKIFSKNLDDTFIKELSDKSGVRESLVKEIIHTIKRISDEGIVSEIDLIDLQNNIETFYSKV